MEALGQTRSQASDATRDVRNRRGAHSSKKFVGFIRTYLRDMCDKFNSVKSNAGTLTNIEVLEVIRQRRKYHWYCCNEMSLLLRLLLLLLFLLFCHYHYYSISICVFISGWRAGSQFLFADIDNTSIQSKNHQDLAFVEKTVSGCF